MEKIGDFSKRCEVTIKTLRWYDKLGLLVPDFIDKFTGYRYYGMEKVAEMQRITELKDIGFSLEEIKQFCSAEKDGEKEQVVWQKRQELEKLADETAHRLRRLTQIEEKLNTDKKGEHNMKNAVDFNIEFENDEAVIGHWKVVNVVDKKENFLPGKAVYGGGGFFDEIYFLPDGEEYWIFSWTKGYVKMHSGDGNLVCPYETETNKINGVFYMFLKYNENLTFVLKQTDKKRYTKHEIGQQDNTDLPFINDEKILGRWVSVDFVRDIDDFNPFSRNWQGELFYNSAEFLPNGELCVVINGNSFNAKWTKGTTLYNTGDGTHAPAYESRILDGREYLFIEWKSGDYIWGGWDPKYYVFVRE